MFIKKKKCVTDLPITLRLFRRNALRFCTRTPGLCLTTGSSSTFTGSPRTIIVFTLFTFEKMKIVVLNI